MRPHPWKCYRCREIAVEPAIVDYHETIVHDGREYPIHLPGLEVPQCKKCGAIVMLAEALQAATAALRREAGLLTPEQIVENIRKLGHDQRSFAALTGIAEATLSRWITGAQIQQRVMDRYLRGVFNFPGFRAALASPEQLISMTGVSAARGDKARAAATIAS